MFNPSVTTFRFDRHLFDGTGENVTLAAKNPVQLLFYFMGSVVVGTIEGALEVLVYRGFKRGDYLPIEIIHEDNSYCGWVSIKEIDLLS